jgi:hypothetical protein
MNNMLEKLFIAMAIIIVITIGVLLLFTISTPHAEGVFEYKEGALYFANYRSGYSIGAADLDGDHDMDILIMPYQVFRLENQPAKTRWWRLGKQ